VLAHRLWKWGGLNILNLFTEQMVTHIHTLMKYGQVLNDLTGSLIQASWESLQLETGMAGQVFEYPEQVHHYLTSTWLSQTLETCQQNKIHIVGMTSRLCLQQHQDIELMQVFIWAGYHKQELQVLNHC